jgi:hypothetical protein
MKQRTGFVSNSSSSSFVVAIKKNDVCPTCHRADDSFLTRFSRDTDDYESSRVMADKPEEIVESLKGNYGSDFEEVMGEEGLFRDILKTYIDNGYEIAYIRLSYYDTGLNNKFQSLRDSKRLVVLKDMN